MSGLDLEEVRAMVIDLDDMRDRLEALAELIDDASLGDSHGRWLLRCAERVRYSARTVSFAYSAVLAHANAEQKRQEESVVTAAGRSRS